MRVAVSGSSAGACSALWLNFHDDLADPDADDPVKRQSTKPYCTATDGAQTSLDPKQVQEWIPNTAYGMGAFGFIRDKSDPTVEFRSGLRYRGTGPPWARGSTRGCVPARRTRSNFMVDSTPEETRSKPSSAACGSKLFPRSGLKRSSRQPRSPRPAAEARRWSRGADLQNENHTQTEQQPSRCPASTGRWIPEGNSPAVHRPNKESRPPHNIVAHFRWLYQLGSAHEQCTTQ